MVTHYSGMPGDIWSPYPIPEGTQTHLVVISQPLSFYLEWIYLQLHFSLDQGNFNSLAIHRDIVQGDDLDLEISATPPTLCIRGLKKYLPSGQHLCIASDLLSHVART